MTTTAEIIARCQALFDDLHFTAREWKAAVPGRKAVGYMPFYVPRELIHAAGVLPLGVLGGGDQLEVIHGDAYYQSYICRIPRSTIELGVTGRLDFLDGMLFPSICDVIRNLSGMWQILFQGQVRRYIDVPQNYVDDIGGSSTSTRCRAPRDAGGAARPRAHRRRDQRFHRALQREPPPIRELYAYRAKQPWQAPTSEVYLLLRAGMVLPVEEHNGLLREYLAAPDPVTGPSATTRASSSTASSANSRR